MFKLATTSRRSRRKWDLGGRYNKLSKEQKRDNQGPIGDKQKRMKSFNIQDERCIFQGVREPFHNLKNEPITDYN